MGSLILSVVVVLLALTLVWVTRMLKASWQLLTEYELEARKHREEARDDYQAEVIKKIGEVQKAVTKHIVILPKKEVNLAPEDMGWEEMQRRNNLELEEKENQNG